MLLFHLHFVMSGPLNQGSQTQNPSRAILYFKCRTSWETSVTKVENICTTVKLPSSKGPFVTIKEATIGPRATRMTPLVWTYWNTNNYNSGHQKVCLKCKSVVAWHSWKSLNFSATYLLEHGKRLSSFAAHITFTFASHFVNKKTLQFLHSSAMIRKGKTDEDDTDEEDDLVKDEIWSFGLNVKVTGRPRTCNVGKMDNCVSSEDRYLVAYVELAERNWKFWGKKGI